jgi:molybdate transport system substrate-binding protein
MKKIFLVLLVLFTNSFSQTITLAVSANVSYAINDLVKEFNKEHKNTKVQVILGSSGKLTAQISNGAPYHLFMSANMKYPQALYENNLALNKPKVYAKGSLVFISKKPQDFSNIFKLLESSNIRKIAIANPKTAPYGIATKEALQNAKIYEKIKNKFIYGESISQTVSYTMVATDIGIVAKSSLYSLKMKKYQKTTNSLDVNPELYTAISQGIVILKNAKDNQEVKDFYTFIFTKKAQKILENYGYKISIASPYE